MNYVLRNQPGTETWSVLSTPTKILSALLLLIAGVNYSHAAVAIYSPRGAEVFGGTQTIVSPVKKVHLQWTYPWERQTPDLIFKVYHSTDLAQPLRQWALLTKVSAIVRSIDVPADKPQEFFFVTASNYLGEVDLLPPLPRTVKLQWNYPVQLQTSDLIFKVYHSTNAGQPLQQWALLTNLPAGLRSAVFPADKSQEFFAVTASNYLGESAMASR